MTTASSLWYIPRTG